MDGYFSPFRVDSNQRWWSLEGKGRNRRSVSLSGGLASASSPWFSSSSSSLSLGLGTSRILEGFDVLGGERLPSKIGPFVFRSFSDYSVDWDAVLKSEGKCKENSRGVGQEISEKLSAAAVDSCGPASPVSQSSVSTLRGPAPSSTARVYHSCSSKKACWAPLHCFDSTNSTMAGGSKLSSPYKSRSLVGNFIPVTTTSSSPSSSSNNNNINHLELPPKLTTSRQKEMEKKPAAFPQQENRGRAGATKSSSRGAASSPRSSPTKDWRGYPYPPQTTPLRARSRSPTKATSGPGGPGETQFIGVSRTADRTLSRSSGEIVIGLEPSSFPSSEGSAGRRGVRGGPPAPINTALARAYGTARVVVRDGGQRPVVLHHPTEREPSPERRAASQMATLGIVAAGDDEGEGDGAGEPGSADFSSVYSRDFSPATAPHPTVAQSLGIEDDGPSMSNIDRNRSVLAHYPSAVSPLFVRKGAGAAAPYPKHMLEDYERWRVSTTPEVGSKNQHHRDGASGSSESGVPAQVPSAFKMGEDGGGDQGRTYSPIASLVPAGLPGRVASKTLIGEHGWLEDTTKGPHQPTTPGKGRKLLGKFVSRAKDMMAGGSSSFGGSSGTTTGQRELPLSLNPREQSLLACELDFAVASALEAYIQSQFARGRVNLDVIKRVAENWARKGRPKVIGFRYDIETQVEIVKSHINDFQFHGHYATNPAIIGVLESMRMAAKAMAVRTYCYPDTVIAKWLGDTRKLFELIGMGEIQVCGIIGIQTFFHCCILEQEKANQKEARQSVGVQGVGFPELDPLPDLAQQQSRPQQQEYQEQPQQQGPYQSQEQQYQERSQQGSHASQQQQYYPERPQQQQYYPQLEKAHRSPTKQHRSPQKDYSGSQQAYGISSQYSQQGHGSTSKQWDHNQTPQQEQRTIDRSRSSPTKRFFTTSPAKKEQTPTPHWSSAARAQHRRELLEPIMRKYSPPKQDPPTPQQQEQQQHSAQQQRQAEAQAYADYQAAYARRLPISSSEKTLRISHSVQHSLNEHQMAREREMHQEQLRRVRSRHEEEEQDDSEFF